LTTPEVPSDPIAVHLVRLEGKIDLTNERIKGLDEIKSTMREDRISGEQRMKQHVEAPNPHPAQEEWQRQRHAQLEDRVKALETKSATTSGRDNAVKWLVGLAISASGALGSLLTYLASHQH
jgi:hypothetical protein